MASQAIRVLRGRRGATQRKIARAVQISPATISLLENGQTTVSPETRAKIRAAVGYTAARESHLGALSALAGQLNNTTPNNPPAIAGPKDTGQPRLARPAAALTVEQRLARSYRYLLTLPKAKNEAPK